MNTIVATSLDNLLELLTDRQPGDVLLAGGADFNVQLRKGMIHPKRVIYIGGLEELRGVKLDGQRLRLGALLTFTDLAENELLRRYTPQLCHSLWAFGSPQIRNISTLGGNIANASPTADSVPLLLTRDAVLELRSASGVREIPLRDFYTGYKRTVIRQDELITAVLLPLDAETGQKVFWRKVGTRRALIIAKLSLAGVGRVEQGCFRDCRLAAGALNEYPRRLTSVENAVNGAAFAELTRERLAEALREDITPIDDLRSDAEYRFTTCLNLIMTCLREWSQHA